MGFNPIMWGRLSSGVSQKYITQKKRKKRIICYCIFIQIVTVVL